MTNAEIYIFMEEMEEFGDEWTFEQAKECYGDDSLEDAIADRRSVHQQWVNIVDTILNA